MTSSQGHCDPRFEPVREIFEDIFNDPEELGASFALSIGDEMVIDLWSGVRTLDRKSPWEEDTVGQISSTSKAVCTLCGLMLVDRGLVDIDEPITSYWPEFAANGKGHVTVRHIFYHATGLAGLDGMPGFDVLNDHDEVARRLAAQAPWFEPGKMAAYHGFTYGYLIDELIRRTASQTLAEFFNDNVREPLGIDYTVGYSGEHEPRWAEYTLPDNTEFIEQIGLEVIKASDYYRAIGYVQMEPEFEHLRETNSLAFVKSNMVAGNGVTNARAVSQIGQIFANDGMYQDQRILSKEIAALPYQETYYDFDAVMFDNVRYGHGFALSSKELPFPWDNAFHWGGFGGSSIIVVPELTASWSFVPNRMVRGRGIMDPRGERLRQATVACLQAF